MEAVAVIPEVVAVAPEVAAYEKRFTRAPAVWRTLEGAARL